MNRQSDKLQAQIAEWEELRRSMAGDSSPEVIAFVDTEIARLRRQLDILAQPIAYGRRATDAPRDIQMAPPKAT